MNGVTLVVAMDVNNVIGKNGDIPWSGRLRGDMRHFKTYTTGKIVVMGRRTFDSIPERYKPLPERRNVVITRNSEWRYPGCDALGDIVPLLRVAEHEEVCIIGGAEIYRMFLPYANKIIVTVVNTEVENGDTYFPDVGQGWNTRVLSEHQADEQNQFSFTIFELTR